MSDDDIKVTLRVEIGDGTVIQQGGEYHSGNPLFMHKVFSDLESMLAEHVKQLLIIRYGYLKDAV